MHLGALRNIPAWCSWVPFADYTSACQPYSEEEIRQDIVDSTANLDRLHPGYTDQRLAEFTQEWQRGLDTDSGRAYQAYLTHPTLSRLIGTSATAKLVSGDYTPYIVIGGIALAALVVVSLRPRRY